jgi:hypothetical protein
MQENAKLTTVVAPGSTCASACVAVFLAAAQRRAAMSSLWYFHMTWRPATRGGLDAVETITTSPESTERFITRYFEPAGVSRKWLKRMRRIIFNNGGYWQTGRDLWNSRSGIIIEPIADIEPFNEPTYLAPAPGCSATCSG